MRDSEFQFRLSEGKCCPGNIASGLCSQPCTSWVWIYSSVPALIPVTPGRPLPGAAPQSVAMGKKTGRGGFGEQEINGYQEVSWRKERSGLRELGSDNGLGGVKKKKDRKFTFVTGEKEEASKGDEMGEDTVKLTAREDVRWKKAIFSLPKYADGLDCNVSLTESNFRKLFLSEKKIKYIIF